MHNPLTKIQKTSDIQGTVFYAYRNHKTSIFEAISFSGPNHIEAKINGVIKKVPIREITHVLELVIDGKRLSRTVRKDIDHLFGKVHTLNTRTVFPRTSSGTPFYWIDSDTDSYPEYLSTDRDRYTFLEDGFLYVPLTLKATNGDLIEHNLEISNNAIRLSDFAVFSVKESIKEDLSHADIVLENNQTTLRPFVSNTTITITSHQRYHECIIQFHDGRTINRLITIDELETHSKDLNQASVINNDAHLEILSETGANPVLGGRLIVFRCDIGDYILTSTTMANAPEIVAEVLRALPLTVNRNSEIQLIALSGNEVLIDITGDHITCKFPCGDEAHYWHSTQWSLSSAEAERVLGTVIEHLN
ncbi:hypothetical protein [Vibrio barjaei]|uniref:hypothetical protein n=1 Tax=Vibrio barjaei TaxID=1676683 RepID=UPI002284F0C6|nr:hypothetical protein [Vibrio barjaei]MCY9874605.1 hypothetical protein [Vibrio barjaei]